MKFSLRFVIVFAILTGTALGLYFVELEARKPITLKIDYQVQMENEVDRPVTMTEFRSRVNVRKVDADSQKYEKRRIAEIVNDFSRFNYKGSYADGFVENHSTVMREAAEVGLKHDKFNAVVSAAWTLGKLGDKSGFDKLQHRILENRETDQNEYWRAFDLFGQEEATLSDELVMRVGEIADSDSNSADEAAFLLYRLNLDNERPLLHVGKVDNDGLEWLLRNRPTKEVLRAVEQRLKSKPTLTYRNQDLISTILELSQSKPELSSIAGTVERILGKFLQKQDIDGFDRDFCISHLKKYGTERSIPFLESQIRNFDAFNICPESIVLLYQFGETESAKRHLLRLVSELSDDFGKWNGDRAKNGLMRIGPEIIGPEKTVELCVEYSSPIGLAEFVEETRDPQAWQRLGCDAESLARAREKAIEYLINRKSRSEYSFSRFAQHWYEAGLSRQKVVDWINEHLKPSKPLTVQSVLQHARYPQAEGIWYTWSRFDHRVDDIHTFLLMALAHSGHGHLAHWEYTHPGAVTHSIEEYAATDGSKFRVGAHDQDGTYPATYSIVVNNRVYHFDVHEGPNGSDERYDVGVIADLMNTIAIRQRLKQRLFIYDAEKGYCLVMFIKPELAQELDAVFSISPDRGTDYYLKH